MKAFILQRDRRLSGFPGDTIEIDPVLGHTLASAGVVVIVEHDIPTQPVIPPTPTKEKRKNGQSKVPTE